MDNIAYDCVVCVRVFVREKVAKIRIHFSQISVVSSFKQELLVYKIIRAVVNNGLEHSSSRSCAIICKKRKQ